MAASTIHAQQKPTVIRVGYFPNMTHAQALVGRANGQFEKAVGPGVQIEWKAFNAGPSAIEALFANAIDMTYVGPNPAVTGYVRSQGEAVRVIAGAASGGAALVVREGSGIKTAADFHGKKVASPQQGNTQDVALRSWLRANGLKLARKRRRRSGPSHFECRSIHTLPEGPTRRVLGPRTVGRAPGPRRRRKDFPR